MVNVAKMSHVAVSIKYGAMLCRQKPLVKTERNRTDYTWFGLGYYKQLGDALQRRLLSVLMLF